jgi:hypothetical protein
VPLVPRATSSSFVAFVDTVTDPSLLDRLAKRCGLPVAHLRDRLVTAAAESAQTLRVLAGAAIEPGQRIIEIGAGLGLTSAYLSSCGFDVTGLEPGGVGFEENSSVAQHLADLAQWTYRVLPIGVEALDPVRHGTFSLVYSNNVLEHVDDVASDGAMVHSCPNYSIPYEPHFGRPLVPVRPRWTARVLPASIRDDSVWRSLNFIRARDVQTLARALHLDVHFRSGALATSLERLGTDAEFRARHRALGSVAVVMRRMGLLTLVRRMPSTWSTPMDFMLCPAGTEPSRVETWLTAGEAN